MTAPGFDFDAPLPEMSLPTYQSWEPAARHYRDLTDEEKQASINASMAKISGPADVVSLMTGISAQELDELGGFDV